MLDPRPAIRLNTLKLLLAAAVGLTMIGLILRRVQWTNGTWNQGFDFQWQSTPRFWPPMLAAVAPALAAQRVRSRWAALTLLAVTLGALQVVNIGSVGGAGAMDRIIRIIVNPLTTSYFSDAFRLHATLPSTPRLVGHFPELAASCQMHAREKPPGQILYYLAWQIVYGLQRLDSAALAGGWGIAVMASAGVYTTYFLARAAELTDRAARLAATIFALLPGMMLFYPSFDPVHATFTGLIVGAWLAALRSAGPKRYLAAALCGSATAVSSFLVYATLTLGALCAAAGVVQLLRRRITLAQLTAAVLLVLLPIGLFYAALWFWSGFDPFSMFRHAYANEMANQASFPLPHHYPDTMPGDLKGFADGFGWVGLPIILCGLWRARRREAGPIVWLAAGQVLLVLATGLLKCETMRIWLFLQPLVLLPLAVELAAWRPWQRWGFVLLQAIVTICYGQNFVCLGLPPVFR